MPADSLLPTDAAMDRAVAILSTGGLVGLPTETVYGLAARGTDPAAVARIYEAKGRPRFNPLIAHVSGLSMARGQGVFSADAEGLAAAFWPGPLTVVVPAAPGATVCLLARAGLDTIALRQPSHPVAAALITRIGEPLVAPSANPSGRLSPITADAVAEGLGDQIELVLDGGPAMVGVESTIVDCTGASPVVLRPGGIPHAVLEAALGLPIPRSTGDPDAPTAPGQLLRHYAPRAALRLNVPAEAPRDPGEAYLGFGPPAGALSLSPKGDLAEAAANLFAMLRALDSQFDRIAVAPIPDTGLGEAINDRLRRAAER